MSRHMRCSKKILFDHFVGPYQERFRDLRPSAFAVLRLITSSNLVDCNTGRSEGIRALENLRGVDPALAIAFPLTPPAKVHAQIARPIALDAQHLTFTQCS